MKITDKKNLIIIAVCIVSSCLISFLISYKVFVRQSGKFCHYTSNTPLGVPLNDKDLKCSPYQKADDILFDSSSTDNDIKTLKSDVNELQSTTSKTKDEVESLDSRVQDIEDR